MNKKIRRYITMVLIMTAAIIFVMSVSAYVIKSKERKRVTKAIEFEQSLNKSLSSYLVGEWNFDDGTVNDSTENELNGIPGSSGPMFHSVDSGRCIRGGCIETNARNDDGFSIPYDNKLTPERLTLSAWISLSEFLNIHSLVTSEEDNYNWSTFVGYFSSDGPRKIVVPGVIDAYHGVGDDDRPQVARGGELLTHRWYHLVVTYSDFGNNKEIYIDGELVGVNYSEGKSMETKDVNFLVGESYAGAFDFIGLIDELKIYQQTIMDR